MNELIAARTRLAFRDAFSDFFVIRTIDEAFVAEGFKPVSALPHGVEVSGARRSLVQSYYEAIDWSSLQQVRRVLRVFEEVLHAIAPVDTDYAREAHRKLLRLLDRDGIKLVDGQLQLAQSGNLQTLQQAMGQDRQVLREHMTRIQVAVDEDPGQALGSAKELVESVAKLVLIAYGEDPDAHDSVPKLAKAAVRCLQLDVDSIPDAVKGAQTMKQVLANLAQIAVGMAELRNLYGTGHGRHRPSSLQPRHGQLGVNAAVAWCAFVLATLDERKPTGGGASTSAVPTNSS